MSLLLVFRRKILCDAKPKPVSRKVQSKRSRLPQSTKGGIIYYAKSEVPELESNLLFLGGGVICYTKSEVLELESNLLFPGGGVIYYVKSEAIKNGPLIPQITFFWM